MAAIGPTGPKLGITVGEFFALLQELPRPDPGFADDLAEVHASQGIAEYNVLTDNLIDFERVPGLTVLAPDW